MSEEKKLTDEKENEKPSVTLEAAKPKKAQKPKKKEQSAAGGAATWFKEVKAEAFKVIWPNKRELAKMTFTVIVTSLIFGALIAGMDILFRTAVDYLISVI